MGFWRPLEVGAKDVFTSACWLGSRLIASWSDPAAIAFYDAIAANGFDADNLIKVLPTLGIIYVAVPKAASTRIKLTLAAAVGRHMISLNPSRRRRFRGPWGPRSMSLQSFHRLATSPATLRFSFVRNPYARIVSCWANKLQGKPLVAGDGYVDGYLARKDLVDAKLPAGPQCTLSFDDFVTYAAAIAHRRLDAHVEAQDDILAMPGIDLDFVGKVESFAEDFARVLDHIGATNGIRSEASIPANASRHNLWSDYYTTELASRVYHAYERDFDRFGYPRELPSKS